MKLNSRGVPARAILLATSVGYVSVIAAALWPETIFLWLVNSSGAVALFVYLLIAVSRAADAARGSSARTRSGSRCACGATRG